MSRAANSRAKVPARLQVGLRGLAGDDDVGRDLLPAETGGDRVGGSLRPLDALIAVDVEAPRPPPREVEARVVDVVERVPFRVHRDG